VRFVGADPRLGRSPVCKKASILFPIAALLLFRTPLPAQDTPVGTPGRGPEAEAPYYLEADHLSVDGKERTLEATGDVRVTKGEVRLEAQQIFVDLPAGRSAAAGGVRLSKGSDVLECDHAEYNWRDETGEIHNANLHFGETGYTIAGRTIGKRGPDTYLLDQGSFTTCDCPPTSGRLPWRIGAHRSEITLGGYARVEKATFYLFEKPALYLPLVYLPVKLHRETGFLLPKVGHSGENGFEMGIPYYWAPNASTDTTVTFQGLTKRGFKPEIQFRYAPSKDTSGQIDVSGLYDQRENSFRYGLKAAHTQRISSLFYDKVDLKLVSDNAYPVNFPDEVGHPSDRFMESRATLGYATDNVHLTGEISYFDLVSETGGKLVPQRAPLVHADVLKRPLLSPLVSYGCRSSLVNFLDQEGSERLRLDLFPRLYIASPRIRDLGLEAEVGIRQTADWDTWEADSPKKGSYRPFLQAGVGTSLPLWRRFQWGSYRLFHIVRPRISYQYVTPLAGDRPAVFDGVDAYWRRNVLTYSVSTSLRGAKEQGATLGPGGDMLECSLAQSIDLARVSTHGARDSLSDVLATATLSPRDYVSLLFDTSWDVNGRRMRSLHAGLRASDRGQRYRVELGYVSVRPHRVDSFTRVELLESYERPYFFPGVGKTVQGGLTARVTPRIRSSLRTVYLLEESGKIENRLDLEYTSACRCWAVLVGIRQTIRPEDIGFSIRFTLEGLGASL